MDIQFTGEHETPQDGWLILHVIVEGNRSYCRVSENALKDFFTAHDDPESQMAAYQRHRATIDGVARILILKGDTNGLGGADVDTAEVERYGMEADAAARENEGNVLPFRPGSR